jgi:hypothetical protein
MTVVGSLVFAAAATPYKHVPTHAGAGADASLGGLSALSPPLARASVLAQRLRLLHGVGALAAADAGSRYAWAPLPGPLLLPSAMETPPELAATALAVQEALVFAADALASRACAPEGPWLALAVMAPLARADTPFPDALALRALSLLNTSPAAGAGASALQASAYAVLCPRRAGASAAAAARRVGFLLPDDDRMLAAEATADQTAAPAAPVHAVSMPASTAIVQPAAKRTALAPPAAAPALAPAVVLSAGQDAGAAAPGAWRARLPVLTALSRVGGGGPCLAATPSAHAFGGLAIDAWLRARWTLVDDVARAADIAGAAAAAAETAAAASAAEASGGLLQVSRLGGAGQPALGFGVRFSALLSPPAAEADAAASAHASFAALWSLVHAVALSSWPQVYSTLSLGLHACEAAVFAPAPALPAIGYAAAPALWQGLLSAAALLLAGPGVTFHGLDAPPEAAGTGSGKGSTLSVLSATRLFAVNPRASAAGWAVGFAADALFVLLRTFLCAVSGLPRSADVFPQRYGEAASDASAAPASAAAAAAAATAAGATTAAPAVAALPHAEVGDRFAVAWPRLAAFLWSVVPLLAHQFAASVGDATGAAAVGGAAGDGAGAAPGPVALALLIARVRNLATVLYLAASCSGHSRAQRSVDSLRRRNPFVFHVRAGGGLGARVRTLLQRCVEQLARTLAAALERHGAALAAALDGARWLQQLREMALAHTASADIYGSYEEEDDDDDDSDGEGERDERRGRRGGVTGVDEAARVQVPLFRRVLLAATGPPLLVTGCWSPDAIAQFLAV